MTDTPTALHRNLCDDCLPVFFMGTLGDSHETLLGAIVYRASALVEIALPDCTFLQCPGLSQGAALGSTV